MTADTIMNSALSADKCALTEGLWNGDQFEIIKRESLNGKSITQPVSAFNP